MTVSTAIEPIIVTKHEDGRTTSHGWPDRVAFDIALLDACQAEGSEACYIADGHVVVAVSNGWARYLITGVQAPNAVTATRIESDWRVP